MTLQLQAKNPIIDWHSCADAVVLAAVARRDKVAFSALLTRHYEAVYRVAWRACRNDADSEDIAQETFLKLWNNPNQVREGNALKGWLMRVASNATMDRFRQKPMQDLESAYHVGDGSTPADVSVDRTRVTARIDHAVAALPERQRLALCMVHFEHMTNISAAKVMEISVDAFESLLSRSRRALKDMLAKDSKHLLAACVDEGE